MNTTAVLIGLFFGVTSIVLCYGVSMITSGLFTRPFYRLYSRVLIGICSVMLLAPGLRWLANSDAQLATFGLTLAQYAVMGILGYGVFRFNRDYMKRVFLNRKSSAYFTFGTLANAAVVTLAFLHGAVAAAPSLGPGFFAASHYGPLLVMLAAMVLSTDYHLKQSVGDLRRFSRFTFVGYALSFLGLAMSMMPYLGNAFRQLGLPIQHSPLLQNFFSAQALLIAIILYAWLVWRYESIPPLFLLLLAVIGEYHVLVTQWVVDAFGPASWGLASLPLFASLAMLDHYFANWDERKRKSGGGAETEQPLAESSLRFAMPFRIVEVGLAVALLGITLWTRSSDPSGSPTWLVVTFGIYACFFLGMAIVRKKPTLVYLGGLLVGLAALLGTESAGGPLSVSLLSAVAVAFGALALVGERGGLKIQWRTPLADCCLLSTILVTVIVFSRHLFGQDPYRFQAVGFLDALALVLAAVAYLICARQYRSWLPVFGVLIALATTVPPWSAAIGLLATAAAALVERWATKENAVVLEDRTLLFGISKLPCEDVLPRLFVQPLSMGAFPLALVGLSTSALHVLQGNISITVLIGASASALALGLLTRTYRVAWLYFLSLAAGYFAVHAIAQGIAFETWTTSEAFSGHLALAASISLVGWCAATVCAAWCAAMIRRVAEASETVYCARRSFYAGWLYDAVSVAAGVALVAVTLMSLSGEGTPVLLLVAALLTSILFALSATLYRSQIGSYLSLTALALAVLNAFEVLQVPRSDLPTVVAGMGLLAAGLAWGRPFSGVSSKRKPKPKPSENALWKEPLPWLAAGGTKLWIRPLAVYAIVCSIVAVVAVLRLDDLWNVSYQVAGVTPLTFALAAAAFLVSTRAFRTPVIYLSGIALAYVASHAMTAVVLDQGDFAGPTQWAQLLVAGGFSLIGCCVAVICASAINHRLKFADHERRDSLLANREFYAGLLQHFVFAASCVTLLSLARAVVFDGLANTPGALMITWVSLPLVAAFSLSGAIYHSRIQTYCALATVCFGLHGAVTVLVPEMYRVTYQTLVVSLTAMLFGVISWLLINRVERRRGSQLAAATRWHECWTKPPLPMISMDASRWGRPLAHVSVFLAFLALFLVGQDWFARRGPVAVVWLTVMPMYLASVTFFIATKTHRFGWLRELLVPGKVDREAEGDAADFAQRGIFYVIFLITGGLAIHLTAQLLVLERLPDRLALSWHLCLTAFLAVLGWSLATLYTIRRNRQLEAAPEGKGLRRDLQLYGGLLHHVAMVAAVIVFAVACAQGVPPRYLSAALLGSIGLLIVYFGLASITYRSQLVSCLSLLAVGLATLHLASFGRLAWPTAGLLYPPAIALLGLVLLIVAGFLTARFESPAADNGSFWLPSPWSRPFPWAADSTLAIWLHPLRAASLFYAVVGLVVISIDPLADGVWQQASIPTLLTYYFVAVTFALAARIYDNPLLTYVAAIVVTISAIPLLLILGEPAKHLGIALSLVAMLIWVAGFVVERYCMRASKAGSEPLASSLARIYERPLIRCSAVLATLAIMHSLLIWKMQGWLAAQFPLVAACAFGAVTLMLNARSLNVLHRVTPARLLVYLACASITGCGLAATSWTWSFDELGPSAAIAAFILALVGLRLTETARSIAASDPSRAERRLTFGEPISQFASGLAVLAVVMAVIAILGSPGLATARLGTDQALGEFSFSQLLPAATTLLISTAVCLMAVRVQADISWLYMAVVFGSGGLCLLLQSETGWPTGTMAVATLVVMNSLVVVAHIVGVNRARVASILGLSESSCQRPFFQWPWIFTTGLLIWQIVYLASIMTGWGTIALEWPWIWVSLLSGSLFLQVFYLRPHSANAHLLVVSMMVGLLGASGLTFDMLAKWCIQYRDPLIQYGSLIAACLALIFFGVGRISSKRATGDSHPRLNAIGKSLMEVSYVASWGAAIAAIASLFLLTPSTPIALSIALGSVCWLWMACAREQETLAYAAVVGFFAAVVYAAHGLLGIPWTNDPLAAFFVIGYSFVLYSINILASRAEGAAAKILIRPSYYIAITLPTLLAVTIPAERTVAAFVLLAAGSFYLIIARQSQLRWALYVAAVLLNVAIYLWVPAAQAFTGLYQLYVIPAAITVLIFAQLHRHELKSQVLTSIRLAASGAILAVSTFEVFFASETGLLQFVALLLLSIAGIMVGIALRIKALVYVGIAFLVINVTGQLGVRFHQEGGVVRAIILIAVGLLILAAMIFFNIHRERILRQYRGFLVDKHWE